MRFEIRASLDGMTLNGIDKLSRDEARSFATQDVDPPMKSKGAACDNAGQADQSVQARKPAPVQASADPMVDTTPLAWMRCHLLRLLPRAAPKTVTLRSSACCGRWASP